MRALGRETGRTWAGQLLDTVGSGQGGAREALKRTGWGTLRASFASSRVSSEINMPCKRIVALTFNTEDKRLTKCKASLRSSDRYGSPSRLCDGSWGAVRPILQSALTNSIFKSSK